MSQRKFIFLEAIDGYSTNTKNVKGHTQFDEIKNKVIIKLFIEGLYDEEYGVDVIIDKNICVNIGRFHGQNKLEQSYNVNSEIKKINAILIYPMNDKKSVILIGYLEDKERISNREIAFLRENKSSLPNRESDREEKLQKEEVIVEGEPIIIIDKDNKINNNVDDSFDEIYEDDRTEQSSILHEKIEIIEEKQSGTETAEPGNKEAGLYNNQIFYLWENIDKLDVHLQSATPFLQPIPNHKWWVIREYDTGIQYYCILYNGYLMPMIYPFMNYKNIGILDRDWIFGSVTEQYDEKVVLKYFVYGIPGRFYMQEQPFKGSTGYLYWQSIDVVKNDPMGYWLLYVDVHTGKIVIPRRPVKPPLNKNIMSNNL